MDSTVLVTGAAGYIGSVVVTHLLARGYRVRALDLLLFGGESLLGVYGHERFEFIQADIRDVDAMAQALAGVDAVVHLAAVVGDPACAKQPELAREVNWGASKELFDLARNSTQVKRFVFASTCSNYGKMKDQSYVDENSPLRPASLYAELKVEFERYLLSSDVREDFVPTSLRFATVYGLSPRPRFDLTVNEFTRDATLGRKLTIYGERFWRPYCHVEDLARSCLLVLESEPGKVRREVFGIGDTTENYQKRTLAEELRKLIPGIQVTYVESKEDPRDYRVDFAKVRDHLGFRITKKVPDGMSEIHRALKQGLISSPDAANYRNI
jgi:nucleoside-diphosphate-sugar epimerase